MSDIIDIPIYVVSYKNEERRFRMTNRFQSLNFRNIKFTKEVDQNDERIINYNDVDKRTWSIMLQHLDSMKDFYENTQNDVCIICEDDIHISKSLGNDLIKIIQDFNELKLDVLMIGYLLPFKLNKDNKYFELIHSNSSFSYYRYPNDIWGTQMYIISRFYAKFLLDKFTPIFAYYNRDKIPYSPDWIITKNGNRALLYPMIAVEEGINLSDCDSQKAFHKRCFETNYNNEKYI